MRWTAAVLVARFVVLAADANAHPLYAQRSVTQSRREGEKHDEESFPPQSPVRDCKRVVFFNRSGTGSGKHRCRCPHARSTECSGGDSCWERSRETGFGSASDGSGRSSGRSCCSASGYPSPTSRPASAGSASHSFDNWPAGGTPPCHLRGRPLRQARCERPSRRFGHMDRELRTGR
jgi:hypothetical protein